MVLRVGAVLAADQQCRTRNLDASRGNLRSQLPTWFLPSLQCVLQQIHWTLSAIKHYKKTRRDLRLRLTSCSQYLVRYLPKKAYSLRVFSIFVRQIKLSCKLTNFILLNNKKKKRKKGDHKKKLTTCTYSPWKKEKTTTWCFHTGLYM